MRQVFHVSAAVCGMFLSSLCMAQPPATAEVTLISPDANPGKQRVGVLLKVASGMHIYWRNTGADTGMPTTVKWDAVPEGVKVGELQWPSPISFKNADGTMGLGYEGEVLLMATLDTSAQKEPFTLVGNVRWLACRDDSCIPGKAKVELKTSDIKELAEKSASVFKKYEDKFPAAKAPENVKLAFAAGKLTIEASELSEASFYPYGAGQSAIGPQKAVTPGKVVLDKVAGAGVVKVTVNGKLIVFEGKF